MLNDILGVRGHGVDPALLDLLAQKASRAYLDQGIPLKTTLKKLIAEHPEFTDHHVGRVVEKSNNLTFQELFENSEDKNIHFDIAEPGDLVRGKEVTPIKSEAPSFSDYDVSPLGHASDTHESEKTAEAHDSYYLEQWGHANPVRDLEDDQVRLEYALDELKGEKASLENRLSTAVERIEKIARHEVLSPHGAGLGGVITALRKVAGEREIDVLLAPLVTDLVNSGSILLNDVSAQLEKTASGDVDMDHPLIQAYAQFEKAAEDLNEVESLMRKTAAVHKKVKVAILGAVGKVMTVAGIPGDVKKSVAAGKAASGGVSIHNQSDALAEPIG